MLFINYFKQSDIKLTAALCGTCPLSPPKVPNLEILALAGFVACHQHFSISYSFLKRAGTKNESIAMSLYKSRLHQFMVDLFLLASRVFACFVDIVTKMADNGEVPNRIPKGHFTVLEASVVYKQLCYCMW